MPEIDVTLPSYAQQERIATALDIIALKENQEAAATLEAMTLNGAMSSEKTLDTACQELLDGTNTTRIFWAWYPRAMALGETNKYKLLSRFLTAAAQAWKDKTYTLRSYPTSDKSGITIPSRINGVRRRYGRTDKQRQIQLMDEKPCRSCTGCVSGKSNG